MERYDTRKAIIAVILLHIIVIGSIFIYDGCSQTTKPLPTKEVAEPVEK